MVYEFLVDNSSDYLKIKSNNEEIDFNDMINNATARIMSGDIKPEYDYMIIDEYQDISKARYNLIKAIK